MHFQLIILIFLLVYISQENTCVGPTFSILPFKCIIVTRHFNLLTLGITFYSASYVTRHLTFSVLLGTWPFLCYLTLDLSCVTWHLTFPVLLGIYCHSTLYVTWHPLFLLLLGIHMVWLLLGFFLLSTYLAQLGLKYRYSIHHVITVLTDSCTSWHYHNSTFSPRSFVTSSWLNNPFQILFINRILLHKITYQHKL